MDEITIFTVKTNSVFPVIDKTPVEEARLNGELYVHFVPFAKYKVKSTVQFAPTEFK